MTVESYKIEIAEEFPYTLIVLCLHVTFVAYSGMALVIPKRVKYFNKEFMKQFNAEHQAAYGTDAAPGGFPDNGHGRYAAKLPYEQWYDFNNRTRAHMNMVEQLVLQTIAALLFAIFHPLPGLIAALLMSFGRVLYILMYVSCGPNKRGLGIRVSAGVTYIQVLYLIGRLIYELSI